ncbi:succinylglutamate desuccinylase, partial [Gammaproteobacteria bacterium]|nr:succinylglutamate desuccinylase [Gammaproteobacteria bacterium]
FEATPLSGVEYLRAPTTGILCHFVEPGQWVRPGESIGVVIDPASTAEQGKAVVVPRHEGLLFARAGHRFVHRGQVVASIATREANEVDEALLPD